MKFSLRIILPFILLIFALNVHTLCAELLSEGAPQLKKKLNFQNIHHKINMDLYYQGNEGNYLIFYDFKRDTLYLQYRIDQWDYNRKDIVQKLNRGLLYRVEFYYLGEVNAIPKNLFKFLRDHKKKSKNVSGYSKKILSVGNFISFDYLYLENLIY